MVRSSLKVFRVAADFPIAELDNLSWNFGPETTVGTYWSGEAAPKGRHFKVRAVWSSLNLYVRFEAAQSEPLQISEYPNIASKTTGLWERDVCEIFVAPAPDEISRYFEFEIAPTGEWVDLGITISGDKRETDADYSSGMQSTARIDVDKVVMAVAIPWKAFGVEPRIGDVWAGNLYRCVGSGPTRGYLAWQPTMTEKPNFHVPERFGEFVFAD